MPVLPALRTFNRTCQLIARATVYTCLQYIHTLYICASTVHIYILCICILTFFELSAVSVVQRVTAWVTGVPVLKLVESSQSTEQKQREVMPTTSKPQTSGKSRKQRASSLEDDDVNARLRDSRPVKRNPRQQMELEQLQKGIIFISTTVYTISESRKIVQEMLLLTNPLTWKFLFPF